jgi:predicted AlkP superfamily pyrophosphatase or phosphodiesterase
MSLVLINAVGLTPKILLLAPRLAAIAKKGWVRSLREVMPAVTCTAQATILTGETAERHGVVANGWLFRDTGEVRFWQQSNRLIAAEPLYRTARKRARERGKSFTCAKLFWWFNQGADVDISITPKPYYAADGNKAFGITGTPEGRAETLEARLGPFPFRTFWGPGAGLPCTQWIARCAAEVIQVDRPDLTLVYLPHLDYEPQRVGPEACNYPRLVAELDAACEPLLASAQSIGARVWLVSEYAHVKVNNPVLVNRVLRKAGLLMVRPGPFGEILDTFGSRAFAVCDHQVAHVYVADAQDISHVREIIAGLPGVAQVMRGEELGEIGLRHERSGELIVLATPDAWFAYPYWLDDRRAPDFARTVDIHRKPGYDPCELFFDPHLWWPKGRALRRLVQKKLGFRSLFDVIPLDPALVRGSHGLPARNVADRPLLVGDGPTPLEDLPMTAVRDLVLTALGLPG